MKEVIKQIENCQENVANTIGSGIEQVIESAIRLIPGGEKAFARHVISKIYHQLPEMAEYIGKSLLEGKHPDDFGLDSPVLYAEFGKQWEKTHDTTLPKYNQSH